VIVTCECMRLAKLPVNRNDKATKDAYARQDAGAMDVAHAVYGVAAFKRDL
jgi:hypothetical protein